jgi:hypothetical protein
VENDDTETVRNRNDPPAPSPSICRFRIMDGLRVRHIERDYDKSRFSRRNSRWLGVFCCGVSLVFLKPGSFCLDERVRGRKMAQMAGKAETETRESRIGSRQIWFLPKLHYGDSVIGISGGSFVDSRNWGGSPISTESVLRVVFVALVLATGVSGFILIYSRRTGGYVLAIIMSVLGVGTVIPDVLGFLPPLIPTLRTILLELSGIPLEVLLIYVSLKALHSSTSV